MGTVIEIPALVEREWELVESNIRDKIAREPDADEMQEHVIGRMREAFFEKYILEEEVRISLPDGLSRDQGAFIESAVQKALMLHRERLKSFIDQIFTDRLYLEIELYRLKYHPARGPFLSH